MNKKAPNSHKRQYAVAVPGRISGKVSSTPCVVHRIVIIIQINMIFVEEFQSNMTVPPKSAHIIVLRAPKKVGGWNRLVLELTEGAP